MLGFVFLSQSMQYNYAIKMNVIENLFKENKTCLLNILEYVNYSTISIRKMTNHRIKRRYQQYRFFMPSEFLQSSFQ